MWKYDNLNNICVQDVLVLLLLCLNWWSDMVIKDRQQDPPSLTFACHEQIAKSLVVDQELLQC
jgi:hypothetical protein